MAIYWEAGHFCREYKPSPGGEDLLGVFNQIGNGTYRDFRVYVRLRADPGHHVLQLRIVDPHGNACFNLDTKAEIHEFQFEATGAMASQTIPVKIGELHLDQDGHYCFVFMDEQDKPLCRLYLEVRTNLVNLGGPPANA